MFFLEKNFISVKFNASTLQVRNDNEEICGIQSKDMKIGKKRIHKEYILLMRFL